MKSPRILLAAPGSGSGKTMITCGILQALKTRGMSLLACKCGPDYIDPMFHETVLQIPSVNLDIFFGGAKGVRALLAKHAKQADFVLMEGVMGYYDGMSLGSWEGSSYDVACVTDTPVILIIPCKGMALSVVALIKGMLEFRTDSHVEGILLNGISEGLYPRMKALIEEMLPVRVIGYMPQLAGIEWESRHLGLITPGESKDILQQMERIGKVIQQTVDLDALLAIAGGAAAYEEEPQLLPRKSRLKRPVRVAVARDEAFCFYYRDNLDLLERCGCELVSFSPLHDQTLPEGTTGLLLGGGYPELYAQELSENRRMREAIRLAVEQGIPCMAECGGFMYLHEQMEGAEDRQYPMVGAVTGSVFRTKKLVRFGYVVLSARHDSAYLTCGEQIRGHEFHYWDSTNAGEDCRGEKPDGTKRYYCMHMTENLFAGYPHLHYYANPEFPARFAALCDKWKEEHGYDITRNN